MSQAIIAYENLIERADTVTASSATAVGPARQAYDGITTTYWEIDDTGEQSLTMVFASAVTADCFGVFAHNLESAGASIVQQYSADSGVTWTDCFAPIEPSDNACVLELFEAVSSTHWRILVDIATAPLYLGVLVFGASLTTYRGMPVGFTLPADNRNTEIVPNRTESGAYVGRSVIPRGSETEIQIQHVPMEWVSEFWRPFIRHAEGKPFFFSWNHGAFPEHCVFASANPNMPASQMPEFKLYNLRLPIVCLGGSE